MKAVRARRRTPPTATRRRQAIAEVRRRRVANQRRVLQAPAGVAVLLPTRVAAIRRRAVRAVPALRAAAVRATQAVPAAARAIPAEEDNYELRII